MVNGNTKYVKIAFIAEKGVFPIFFCPRKLFSKNVHNSYIFMMAHFEAKKHEKTIESPKSSVVKGQMSAIL